MINSEKKRVVLRSKSGSRSKREVETIVSEYEESRIAGTNIVVSAAVATFNLKGEDRHQVLRLDDDEAFRKCQKKLKCEPRMAAFVGVYDGHDGDLASDYCSKGLVPHIISELTPQSSAQTQRWSFSVDRANAPLNFETSETKDRSSAFNLQYIAAFQKAQNRFQNKLEPPSFEEVCKPGALKVSPSQSFIQWMATPTEIQRGGTTACTLSVFAELGEDTPTVVVANCGDSRLITDDGTGSSKYRQVTTDHRPSNSAEKRRLTECIARGECNLHRSTESADMRIFPGGLAVSRTIGDGNCSRSAICTPEVINVPLKTGEDQPPEERTQRFVLASDGLWDAQDNVHVGKAAARILSLKRTGSKDLAGSPKRKNKICSPKESATKILQQCLESPGGRSDDITVCVVDVSYVS